MKPVEVRRQTPEIAVVTLRREDKLNSMTDELIGALISETEALAADPLLKAVVISGGDRAFSSGADVSLLEYITSDADVRAVRRTTAKMKQMLDVWQALPPVTIAAVEGGAVGGAFGLTLACDWRVLSETAWAYIPETKLGTNYAGGNLPRLASLVGPARAKWMAILARRHLAAELQSWGLAEEVTPAGGALEAALRLAEEVASLPPTGVQMIKRTVNNFSLAMATTASHADMDEMLACLRDSEGGEARAKAMGRLTSKT